MIIKQNWDYYYEADFDDGEADIDENGFAYYVIYGEYDDLLSANRSRTCISCKEAIELAEDTVKSELIWRKSSFP